MMASSEEEGESQTPACSNCGLSYNAYRKTLLLGCSDCYESFGDLLVNDLRKIHGAVSQHGGPAQPAPERAAAAASAESLAEKLLSEAATTVKEPDHPDKIQEIEATLRKAIEREDFQLAAQLRDSLRGLKEGRKDEG